jgi:hypothetical protein
MLGTSCRCGRQPSRGARFWRQCRRPIRRARWSSSQARPRHGAPAAVCARGAAGKAPAPGPLQAAAPTCVRGSRDRDERGSPGRRVTACPQALRRRCNGSLVRRFSAKGSRPARACFWATSKEAPTGDRQLWGSKDDRRRRTAESARRCWRLTGSSAVGGRAQAAT